MKITDIAKAHTLKHTLPHLDKEKYQERDGLEGPIMTKSGKVVYFDPKEDLYYDPDTDMYIDATEYDRYDDNYDYSMVSKIKEKLFSEEITNELNVPNDIEKVKANIQKLEKMAKDAYANGDPRRGYNIERSSEMLALQRKLIKLGGNIDEEKVEVDNEGNIAGYLDTIDEYVAMLFKGEGRIHQNNIAYRIQNAVDDIRTRELGLKASNIRSHPEGWKSQHEAYEPQMDWEKPSSEAKCTACNGTGWDKTTTSDEDDRGCDECGGTGKIDEDWSDVKNAVKKGAKAFWHGGAKFDKKGVKFSSDLRKPKAVTNKPLMQSEEKVVEGPDYRLRAQKETMNLSDQAIIELVASLYKKLDELGHREETDAEYFDDLYKRHPNESEELKEFGPDERYHKIGNKDGYVTTHIANKKTGSVSSNLNLGGDKNVRVDNHLNKDGSVGNLNVSGTVGGNKFKASNQLNFKTPKASVNGVNMPVNASKKIKVKEEDGVSAEDLKDIIIHRIKQNKDLMLGLLDNPEGLDGLIDAIEDVSDFYSGTTEVGSSDVSAMVDAVKQNIGYIEDPFNAPMNGDTHITDSTLQKSGKNIVKELKAYAAKQIGDTRS